MGKNSIQAKLVRTQGGMLMTQDNIDNIFDLVVVVGFQIVEFEFVDNNNTGILLVKFFIFIKNLVRV